MMDAILPSKGSEKICVCLCVCVCVGLCVYGYVCGKDNKKDNVAKYSKVVTLCKGYIVVLCNFINIFLKLQSISKWSFSFFFLKKKNKNKNYLKVLEKH